jgi:ABC-type Fe3+/spermidine/putrescine transport system ATPase subunit
VLHAALEVRLGALDLALDLDVSDGEVVALLGPNGAGKSTALRAVAGLQPLDAGRVELDGVVLDDPAAGVFVPVARRPIGLVFQDYLLFPRMSARDNVAFGLRARGVGKAEARRRAGEWLDRLGLDGHADARPAALSGGQAQRVALARALATDPRLLLLDEPLAALDEKIRREMQGELTGIQEATGTTFVYVTHDQEEALTMSDRIAVLNRGRCVQVGEPERIFRLPRTRFVAGFFRGCNVLEARIERNDGSATLVLAGHRLALEKGDARAGPRAVALRGESLLLGRQAKGADLVLPARLEKITYRGVYRDYRLRLDDGQELSATLTQRLPLTEGSQVQVGIRADEIVLLEEG